MSAVSAQRAQTESRDLRSSGTRGGHSDYATDGTQGSRSGRKISRGPRSGGKPVWTDRPRGLRQGERDGNVKGRECTEEPVRIASRPGPNHLSGTRPLVGDLPPLACLAFGRRRCSRVDGTPLGVTERDPVQPIGNRLRNRPAKGRTA